MIRLGLQNLQKLGFRRTIKSLIQPTVVETLSPQAKLTSVEFIRTTSFFNKLNAEAIWKSVNTVSNAGKKRGRGKSSKKKSTMNLYKGQQIGVGRANIRWPGLNSPVLQGQDVIELEKLPQDPEYDKKIIAARSMISKKGRQSVHPLERGWSGRSILGKSLGPPEMIEHKEGFDSYVLETKFLKLTNAKLGKVRSIGVFLVVGNKNGLIGISSAKGVEAKIAVKRAQRLASNKLFHIKLEDAHTVNHDFFYQFGITKLFVYKKPPGYGLVCNRGIAVCCRLLGIQDLYAKVEGSTNKQNVVKAFLLGLLEQKTYQQMADDNKLHLVEQREEAYMFPKVLASPAEVMQNKDQTLTFAEYVMNGKLPLKKEKKPAIEYVPDYAKHLKRTYYARNHDQVKLRLMVDYGRHESHLTEIYPECRPPFLRPPKGASSDVSEQ